MTSMLSIMMPTYNEEYIFHLVQDKVPDGGFMIRFRYGPTLLP